MKILIIHSHYQFKGGEEFVYEQEYALLKEAEEVRKLLFYNKSGIKGAFQFFLSIWNVFSAKKVKQAILKYKPDVIHIHNTHYATGPIIIRTAKKLGIPIVLTLHNYRLLCPSGTFLHQNTIFTDSLEQDFPWNAVKKGVFRNSIIQTFWSALVIWFHKKIGTWEKADAIILLTDFAKELFINSYSSIDTNKIYVKPNFVPDPKLEPGNRTRDFLYVGRLSVEKGIEVLLDAFIKSGQILRIGGTGQLKEKVLKASNIHTNIIYLGNLNKHSVLNEMLRCNALLITSTWYEGMPITILEAFAVGTCVIASNIGAMASMIKHGFNGLHFEVGNKDDLIEKLNYWQSIPESSKCDYMKNAKKTYLDAYTPEKNKEQLLSIYMKAILSSNVEIE